MTVGEASSSSATADGDGNTRGSGGTYHQGNWTKRGRTADMQYINIMQDVLIRLEKL